MDRNKDPPQTPYLWLSRHGGWQIKMSNYIAIKPMNLGIHFRLCPNVSPHVIAGNPTYVGM